VSAPADIRREVEDLYAAYVWSIAGAELDAWAALFAPDAVYKAVSRENVERGWPLALILCDSGAAIEDRAHAISQLMMTVPRVVRQTVSGWRIAPDGEGRWSVQAHFIAVETLSGQMTKIYAAGLHDDVVARGEDGVLRFFRKTSICDGDVVPNSLVMPV